MLNDDHRATSPSVSSPALLVGSMLAPNHNTGTSSSHTSHHPSILALNTCETFSSCLTTPGGMVEAALVVACRLP